MVAASVPIAPVLLVIGLDIDTSAALVDGNLHARQLAPVAARPLDRLNRDLVAGACGHDDVAGDVGEAEAAVAADLDLAREALGLLGAVVASLVSPRPERAD